MITQVSVCMRHLLSTRKVIQHNVAEPFCVWSEDENAGSERPKHCKKALKTGYVSCVTSQRFKSKLLPDTSYQDRLPYCINSLSYCIVKGKGLKTKRKQYKYLVLVQINYYGFPKF